MKKYENYKDSGIDWLGEIPSHWEVKKMKYLFSDFSKKNMPNEVLLSVTQNQGVVPREWVENRMVMPSGNLESFKFITKGDFCISLRSFEGGLEYCYHNGIVSPAYTVLKGCFKHYDSYYKYLFKSAVFIDELQLYIVGIREGKNISYELLKYCFLTIPPLQEQEAIATFLDDKCSQIDKAVEIKEKQIALLKEQRQIIIHNAVTKGIDKNVKLKDSGVDWIGEIPEHWEVLKVKYIFNKINTGTTPSTSVTDYFDGTINWYNPRDLNNEYLNFSEKKVTFKAIEYKQVKFFEGDSILVVGIGATAGKTSYLTKTSTFNQQITGFKTYSHNNKYYYYHFSSLSKVFLAVAQYTTLPILNNEFFKKQLLTIPPKEEQQNIVTYLEEQTSKIDKAIEIKTAQIEKLKEYKQSLINEVVTGKVRVSEP